MRGRLALATFVVLGGCLFPDLSELGGVDGSTSDAADGSSDGPLDASAGCGHTFCDDFDDAALGSGWDKPVPSTVTLTDAAVSPPHAMSAISFPADAGDDNAFLVKHFPAASHIHVSADVGSSCPSINEADYFDIVTDGPDVYQVGIFQSSSNMSLYERFVPGDAGAATEIDNIMSDVPYDADAGGLAYVHYDVTLDFGSSSWLVTANNKAEGGGQLVPPGKASAFSLRAGILYHSTFFKPCTVRIDNVVVDATP